MTMESTDPAEILRQARAAVTAADYPQALEKYQWFYHHATEIRPSLYGVRLSYCLNEWADLGEIYPPALDALQQLKDTTREAFDHTPAYETFHEYAAIAGHLNSPEEVFERFLQSAEQDPQLARRLFTFVWEYCAQNALWGICYQYMGTAGSYYTQLLETYDHMLLACQGKSEEIRQSFIKEALQATKREAQWLADMLKTCGTADEYHAYIRRLRQDLSERGQQTLAAAIG